MAKVNLELVVSEAPSFLQLVGAEDDAVIDIAHVPEMQLRALGEEWTAQLIEEARIRAADIQGIPS